MQKFLKILKRILFWTFFVSLSVVTISTVLVKIYEDDIEQYAITEINKHVNTNIEVRDIDLSVLHNFPYASLNFQNVLINDAYEYIESDDTLLFAENLFLSFNMWDLWNENYIVKNVKVEDAKVKIDQTNARTNNPIYIAAKNSHFETLQTLLTNNGNINKERDSNSFFSTSLRPFKSASCDAVSFKFFIISPNYVVNVLY